MDTVINRLPGIEAVARTIVEEVNTRKKTFVEEMNVKTVTFGRGVEQGAARRIVEIQEEVETDMDGLLAKQKTEPEALLKELEDNCN